MLTNFLLFAIFSSVYQVADTYRDSTQSVYVHNGEEAVPHSRPFQVRLIIVRQIGDEKKHKIIKCGGSIISKFWILSAAHCYRGVFIEGKVIAGMHIENNTETEPRQERDIILVCSNPLYGKGPYFASHDIMLGKVDRPFIFDNYVRSIMLAPAELTHDVVMGEPVTISGWGRFNRTGSQANVLQKVTMTLAPNQDCGMDIDNDFSFCLYGLNHNEPAQAGKGDSGGPGTLDPYPTLPILLAFSQYSNISDLYHSIYGAIPKHIHWIHEVQEHYGYVERLRARFSLPLYTETGLCNLKRPIDYPPTQPPPTPSTPVLKVRHPMDDYY